MIYYTYAFLREDKTPYYIGKGKGNRAYRRRKTDIKPPKDKSRILILKNNLTEEEAFRHEVYMIAVFGRKDLGTGILRNRTDGGEGASNPSQETREKKKIPLSQETKDKISKALIGKNNPFFGKKHSRETKNKISISVSGENNSKSIHWRITFADGRIINQCGLANWAKENSYDTSHIYGVFQGKRKYHKDIVAVEKLTTLPPN
jgi:hypothetical protein